MRSSSTATRQSKRVGVRSPYHRYQPILQELRAERASVRLPFHPSFVCERTPYFRGSADPRLAVHTPAASRSNPDTLATTGDELPSNRCPQPGAVAIASGQGSNVVRTSTRHAVRNRRPGNWQPGAAGSVSPPPPRRRKALVPSTESPSRRIRVITLNTKRATNGEDAVAASRTAGDNPPPPYLPSWHRPQRLIAVSTSDRWIHETVPSSIAVIPIPDGSSSSARIDGPIHDPSS